MTEVSDSSRTPTATLITGASSGLGVEIARHLARDRRLILAGRNVERLEDTRRSCDRPDEHLVWPFELGDVDGIEASLAALLSASGVHVDSFVHCAGVLNLRAFRAMDLAIATQTMNVNFMSALAIVRTLLRRPINGGQLRSVVFISSTASRFGAKGFSVYSASKGALDAFMRGLAVELGPTVRVNSVLPGAVKTEMTSAMFADADLARRIEKDYPLGVGTGQDIASAVAFLLSDAARWITGQQLVVDGGRTVNITA